MYREDIVNTLKLVTSADGVPTLLRGTATFASTRVRALANCDAVPRHQTRQVTLTRTA